MSLIPAFLKNLLIIVELFDIMIEKITTGIIYFIFQKFTIFHNLVVYKPNLKLTNQKIHNLVINNKQISQIYCSYVVSRFSQIPGPINGNNC